VRWHRLPLAPDRLDGSEPRNSLNGYSLQPISTASPIAFLNMSLLTAAAFMRGFSWRRSL